MAVIASAMGTARMPTQGSWRPLVITSTGSLFKFTERPAMVMLEVGFKAMVAIIGWPELMPPKIPPCVVRTKTCWRHFVTVLRAFLLYHRKAITNFHAFHRINAH